MKKPSIQNTIAVAARNKDRQGKGLTYKQEKAKREKKRTSGSNIFILFLIILGCVITYSFLKYAPETAAIGLVTYYIYISLFIAERFGINTSKVTRQAGNFFK